MGIKDKPLRQPPADGGTDGEKNKPAAQEPAETAGGFLNQRLNNFLIDYFGYLTLALSFIIFIAGLFLFIQPQYQLIAQNAKTAEQSLQAEYEASLRYLEAIRNLKDSYALIDPADRKKIEEMVPVNNDPVSLFPEIESIVLKNGAVLDYVKIEGDAKGQSKAKIKPGPADQPEAATGIFEQLPAGVGLAKIEVSISSVNYPVLKNLLKTFENNLRLADIAKVDYKAEENQAVFTVYFYYIIP